MMNNPEMQRQFQAAKEMAAQSGIGGAVYLDVDQAKGTLRMKFKVTPEEEQDKLVVSLAYVIAQMSQAIGLQVNTRETKKEEVNNG
jgi:hypothetical protein